MHYGSPNRIVWNYFAAIRRLAASAAKHPDNDERKQDLALCIILSITAIEAFVNVYFRVVVSEAEFTKHLGKVEGDLKAQAPLVAKLKTWPKVIFGKEFNMGSAAGIAFNKLRDRRNRLIHFTSSHETIHVGDTSIHGLADMTAFDALSPADADEAVGTAEAVISEIFLMRGIPNDQVPQMLHGWTGSWLHKGMTSA